MARLKSTSTKLSTTNVFKTSQNVKARWDKSATENWCGHRGATSLKASLKDPGEKRRYHERSIQVTQKEYKSRDGYDSHQNKRASVFQIIRRQSLDKTRR